MKVPYAILAGMLYELIEHMPSSIRFRKEFDTLTTIEKDKFIRCMESYVEVIIKELPSGGEEREPVKEKGNRNLSKERSTKPE